MLKYDIGIWNYVGVFMENKIIEVTEKALAQIHEIYQKEKVENMDGLRIGVTGGGCSGLSYSINFDAQKERDNVIELGDIKILIDPKSSIYLKGVTLDFKDGLSGKGFVFSNPNATNTCGCGESFSV